MHKYIILFFSVLVFLTACRNEGPPADVIKEPQMIKLLTDIHLVDGQLYAVPQQPDSLYKYGAKKYIAVFKKYHTTDASFKKSLKYYSTQPELIQAMYDTIQKKIQFKVDSLSKVGTKKLKNAVPKQ
jgi:hypothetical protein